MPIYRADVAEEGAKRYVGSQSFHLSLLQLAGIDRMDVVETIIC